MIAIARTGGPLGHGPVPVELGIRRVEQIQQLMGSNPEIQQFAMHVLTHLLPRKGQFEEARKVMSRWREMLRERGSRRGYATSANCAFEVFSLAGDWAEAESMLREAVEILEGMGETNYRSWTTSRLAEALFRQGKLDEAERYTVISEEATSTDNLTSQVGWRMVRASVLASRAQLGEAERLAREAVSLSARTDQLDIQGDALLVLATVLELTSRPAEAAQEVAQALALYERKGNLVMAGRARARLEEISAPPH